MCLFVLSSAGFVAVAVTVFAAPASSQLSLPYEILPEPLGYSLVFHIAFLLPIFSLHGLETGNLQTLRVGICFAGSSACLMAFASALMGDSQGLASVALAVSALSAALVFVWSFRFYCRLRFWGIKTAALAREDSSFVRVFA